MQLAFACDAMGADLPTMVSHALKLRDEAPVQDQFEAASPSVIVEPAVTDLSPLRELLTVVLNAILYATADFARRGHPFRRDVISSGSVRVAVL